MVSSWILFSGFKENGSQFYKGLKSLETVRILRMKLTQLVRVLRGDITHACLLI